jgi:hypothetical protein
VFALGLLAAGVATLWRKSAAIGLLVLTALHFSSALGWIRRIAGHPGSYGVWYGLFEQIALVAAGVVTYAALAPITSMATTRAIQTGRFMFGICALSFALGHFTAIPESAGFVPEWLPPGKSSGCGPP